MKAKDNIPKCNVYNDVVLRGKFIAPRAYIKKNIIENFELGLLAIPHSITSDQGTPWPKWCSRNYGRHLVPADS